MDTLPALATVLVVQHNHKLNDAYCRLLEGAGYRVNGVYNGREALDHIRAVGDPAVIILGMHMPVMEGLAFLRACQPLEHPRTAVVVFSKTGTRTEVEEAYALGVTRYVLTARATSAMLVRLVAAALAILRGSSRAR